MNDASDLIEGHLLIPHPLLLDGYGIDLSVYFEAPSSLDLVDWVHEKVAYPYAAKGPLISAGSWRNFRNMTTGNTVGFVLFFN
ncbi:MAG: hypothetical protein AAGG57_19180 [Pseudomonadota bacterium]